MTQPLPLTGQCLCGGCRIILRGPPNWVGHCHCESCRRATASPVTTFVGHPNGMWQLNGPVQHYESRTDVTRGFCGTCGSPVFYRSTRYPDETHFYAALLDNPALVAPDCQFHTDETLPWTQTVTTLPQG